MAGPSKRIALVVGAGASKEVSLPLGLELREKISAALDFQFGDGFGPGPGNRVIFSALRTIAKRASPQSPNSGPYFEACRSIRRAMRLAQSIDNFIDSRRSEPLIATCGKLAIAQCILEAESQSSLFLYRSGVLDVDYGRIEKSWLTPFFQNLIESCQAADLDERLAAVTIVCFNYDRCIEHYLFHSLQNYYEITAERAAEILSRLRIFHPYGSVGRLPWQGQENAVDFGTADLDGTGLAAISEGIRTFTEGTDPENSKISEIREALRTANVVAFLGFAFHKLNLQLLFPERIAEQGRRVYATGKGLSRHDGAEIVRELSNLGVALPDHFFFRNDLSCAELFGEFRRGLSFWGKPDA